MALSDISLTAGMRQNLLSLQSTATLLDRTQTRLSTGKKVNTALDNPTNFFSAQANTQRANDLSTRKDGMSEAVQGVQAANQGITAITALIEAAKGLTQAAASADTANRNALAGQYNEVLTQISKLAGDSGYKGKNFLTGDSLSVLFNENGGSSLAINGFDATSKGLGINALTIATSATAAYSGSANGTASVAVHQASIDTALPSGAVAASTKALGVITGAGSTTLTGAKVSGTRVASGAVLAFSLTGIPAATGGLYTGAITVNKVYANGVDVTNLFAGKMSGSVATTGQFLLGITSGGVAGIANALIAAGQSGATVTGAVITLDVTVGAHSASGQKLIAAGNVFKLQVGDQVSGLNILSGNTWNGPAGSAVAGQTHTGLAVFVDGVYKAQGTAWSLTGNNASGTARIIFATGVVPPSSSVTYAYNSGFVSTTTDPVNGGQLAYGGAIKFNVGSFDATKMAITNVKLDGKVLSGSQFSVSSTGTINLAAGVKKTSFVSKLTYDLTTNNAGGWDTNKGIESSVNELNTAIDTLRTESANLASNLNVVTIRQDFTNGMIATLQKGADNLTLADMNEEGANMLMLQTRQQLGTTSLKMASDAAQSVLRLF